MVRNTKVLALTFAVLAAAANPNWAGAVALTGTSYFQDFNSLGTFDAPGEGLPDGWSVRTGATGSYLGDVQSFSADVKAWDRINGGFANYASIGTDARGATGAERDDRASIQARVENRALGIRPVDQNNATFPGSDPGAAFVFQIDNTLGLGNFELNVDLLLLTTRNRNINWLVQYGIGVTPTEFVTVGGVNTFDDLNEWGSSNHAFYFPEEMNNVDDYVWIRIVTLGESVGSGRRDTFAIDNFHLTYSAVPEPASLSILGLGAVALISRRRK